MTYYNAAVKALNAKKNINRRVASPSYQNPIDQVAKSVFGIDYLFPFQRLVISNIIEGQDQIVILPTGAGKSLCFSVPAAFLDGPTLIIFPLLALMADQARRLKDTGLGVQILRGGQSRNERDAIFNACAAGKVLPSGPRERRKSRYREMVL